MTSINEKWAEQQRRRWMRSNAHLYVRPDVHRYMAPSAPHLVGKNASRYFRPGLETNTSTPRREIKFDPDQPRVPAGNPDGGQWTRGNAGSDAPLDAPTDISAARSRVNEAECDVQYKRDTAICNLVHTPLCWSSANERYAACLSGRQIPELRF